jgi:hypothetical protein
MLACTFALCASPCVCVRGHQVWDMADLGFQATAHIMGSVETAHTARSSEGHDPLTRLAGLTGNFPTSAKWLSTLPVPDGVKDEVAAKTR